MIRQLINVYFQALHMTIRNFCSGQNSTPRGDIQRIYFNLLTWATKTKDVPSMFQIGVSTFFCRVRQQMIVKFCGPISLYQSYSSLPLSYKSSYTQCTNERVWLCSNKTLLCKTADQLIHELFQALLMSSSHLLL